MDVFDKYLFDEITQEYQQDDLSSDDYEELYQRFLNLHHIPEVKAYLFAMRSLGYGTKADEDSVLLELENSLGNSIALDSLYYDCLLFKNREDDEAVQKLSNLIEKGYSDIYLKEKSHINYNEEDDWDYSITCGNCGCEFGITKEENAKETVIYLSCNAVIYLDDIEDDDEYAEGDIDFVKMEFYSNGIQEIYFTSNDIDYINAEVFFEPIEEPCRISVRSQVFDYWDNPISDIMEEKIYLDKGDYSFCTKALSSEDLDGYSADWLKWVIEINDLDKYSREFMLYEGKIQKPKLHIDEIKLFASGTNGAKEDMDNCTTYFNRETLEHIYFMVVMETEPGFDMYVEFSIKVFRSENNSVVFDECFLQSLDHDTYACWQSVGYPIPNYWDKGLYKYVVKIGDSNDFEGYFTVV